ncbi:MAG: CaiB/BaiF CoA transferase family protein [bacterium]
MSEFPLDGVRVLDLSRLLPGPFATQILADNGADVIKIEEPEVGDYARYMEPYVDDVGLIFSAVNRGKRSLTLDLTTDDGRAIFLDLVEDADVVLEGFSPGTVDELGIDWITLADHNPDLVYCALSGYGQSGVYRNRPGHDLNYAGYTGLLDMTRSEPDGKPAIPGFPMADMSGGLTAAQEIVTALLGRELGNTGGTYLDLSLTESLLSFSQVITSEALAGESPRAGETFLTGQYPCYGIYEAKDGKYVTLSALEPKFWTQFCERVNRTDLESFHLSEDPEDRQTLREELQDLFRRRTRDEWEREFGDSGVMVGSVLEPQEVVDNEHFRERDDFNTGEFRVSIRTGAREEQDWPEKGEHNRQILSNLNYDEEQINSFETRGVL